jgi:hypothetical protein
MRINSLKLERIGQIKQADVTFGDLTVFVGPQATGKSIFLQFLKLLADTGYVHDQLRKHGIDWNRSLPRFLNVYFGEGMEGIWRTGDSSSMITVDGRHKDANELAQPRRRSKTRTVFYIPAQRVLSLANGWPRPFTSFASEDPFAVRDFSETFRILMEQELGRSEALFPKTNRLKQAYRDLLSEHVFCGFGLKVDHLGAQKRLVLQHDDTKSKSIPYMAWSAGQREFVPLLMGLYWLMPPSKVKRRENIEWVVIEELEMGLHPNAISVVLLLVLELLWRGYRVCLSTHSPHVLEMVWALQGMRQYHADPGDLLDLFEAPKSDPMKRVAETALKKEARVYYFDPEGVVKDISGLDPGSETSLEADWGGLIGFSKRVNEIVARAVNASLSWG